MRSLSTLLNAAAAPWRPVCVCVLCVTVPAPLLSVDPNEHLNERHCSISDRLELSSAVAEY